jgi:hypothetical protein
VAPHTFAKMIITVWEIEEERYFTLTFTTTSSTEDALPKSKGKPRIVTKATYRKALKSNESSGSNSGSGTRSNPSSVSSGRSSRNASSNASAMTSPTAASMSGSPFPPYGPPSRSSTSTTTSNMRSTLQKIVLMKDRLLDNTEVPIIAMWKDGSIAIPNKAARALFHQNLDPSGIQDGKDLLPQWHLWDTAFTKALDPSEYPISVLIRTQTPFPSRKIGLYHPETGNKVILDCVGETMNDEETGDFLAGIITCKDITSISEEITEIKETNEQRFQLICNTLPQMLWTTTPEGMHEWFSDRWYFPHHPGSD